MGLPLNLPATAVEPPNRIWLRPARAVSVVARALALGAPASAAAATAATKSKAGPLGVLRSPPGLAMSVVVSGLGPTYRQ